MLSLLAFFFWFLKHYDSNQKRLAVVNGAIIVTFREQSIINTGIMNSQHYSFPATATRQYPTASHIICISTGFISNRVKIDWRSIGFCLQYYRLCYSTINIRKMELEKIYAKNGSKVIRKTEFGDPQAILALQRIGIELENNWDCKNSNPMIISLSSKLSFMKLALVSSIIIYPYISFYQFDFQKGLKTKRNFNLKKAK